MRFAAFLPISSFVGEKNRAATAKAARLRLRIDFQNPSFYKPAHARAIRPGAVSIAPKPARQSSCYKVTESRRAAPRGIKTNEAYLPTVQTRPQAPARF